MRLFAINEQVDSRFVMNIAHSCGEIFHKTMSNKSRAKRRKKPQPIYAVALYFNRPSNIYGLFYDFVSPFRTMGVPDLDIFYIEEDATHSKHSGWRFWQ